MEETLVDNTPKIEEKLLGVSLDPLIPLESIMTDSLASGIHRNIIVSENRKYLSNCSRMREYIYNWLVFSHILTHSHINKLILCPFCHTSSMDSHRRVFWTFHTNINLFVS